MLLPLQRKMKVWMSASRRICYMAGEKFASSARLKQEGGVVISKRTLVAYLKSNKKFTGITIARFS